MCAPRRLQTTRIQRLSNKSRVTMRRGFVGLFFVLILLIDGTNVLH